MARYFPIFLDLHGRPCLVVGAGAIATGKARQLLNYGAVLTIVAPQATEEVREWARSGRVNYHAREFRESDLDGQKLVIGSTDSPDVNRAVYEAADRRGIMANIVDVPELCSFVYGSLVERGDLQIAISTSGRSPSFASHLRKQLEAQFGEEYGTYLDILGQCREIAKKRFPDMEQRKAVLDRVMRLDLLELIREGKREEASREALECVSRSSD